MLTGKPWLPFPARRPAHSDGPGQRGRGDSTGGHEDPTLGSLLRSAGDAVEFMQEFSRFLEVVLEIAAHEAKHLEDDRIAH